MSKDAFRQVADQLGITAMHRIRHLFRERFGTEPGTASDLRRNLTGWLCTELEFEASEAEQLPLDQLAILLAADQTKLSRTDRDILEALLPGQVLTHDEIAERAGYQPKSVRTRLQPSNPLRTSGFVKKVKDSPGYQRGSNFWHRDNPGATQGQHSE